MTTHVLEIRRLVKHFSVGRAVLKAVDGIDLVVTANQVHGLVGESGCGKTTAARVILRLTPATSGKVRFEETDVLEASSRRVRGLRRRMQLVSQNPLGSLNPRMAVGSIIAEPLEIHRLTTRSERSPAVSALMESVGLDVALARRYPHQLSGGQRQRVSIARALATNPSLLVCDEPVSALDVSIRAQILVLLGRLREERGLSMLFISHDLAVVRSVADRVSVMYLGRIVESGSRNDIFDRPSHPYTMALLSAVPEPDPAVERSRVRIILRGDPANPLQVPSGCRFRTRCPIAQSICVSVDPPLVDRGSGHVVACHFPGSPLI